MHADPHCKRYHTLIRWKYHMLFGLLIDNHGVRSGFDTLPLSVDAAQRSSFHLLIVSVYRLHSLHSPFSLIGKLPAVRILCPPLPSPFMSSTSGIC